MLGVGAINVCGGICGIFSFSVCETLGTLVFFWDLGRDLALALLGCFLGCFGVLVVVFGLSAGTRSRARPGMLTAEIQENMLPLYHAICRMLELRFL